MKRQHIIYSVSMILLLIIAVAGWFATDYLGNNSGGKLSGKTRLQCMRPLSWPGGKG